MIFRLLTDMSKKTNKRKSIPETTKLRLWIAAGGRCEFKGCNEYVWQNGLTLSDGNFAEVAHIIGSSKDGPRGTEQSAELQIDFSNLMLLCQRCHKEIDDHWEKYPAELLRHWKQEHEDRIEIQTCHPEDIHKSTILLCSINIGERTVPINIEAVRNAMFPKYPSDRKGIKIEESDFDRFGNANYWQTFAENKLKRKVKRFLEEGIDEIKIKHLSIFGVAPMPLLIYLGKCVGDTVPADIYQSHRNIENTSKTWSWQDDPETEFDLIINESNFGENDKVILKLALSDNIEKDKFENLLVENPCVYEITIPAPSPHWLKNKKQLENFSYEYRKLLNLIQKRHGRNCKISVLPAVPIAVAIECGRVIIPTKDPEIVVCEYYADKGGFEEVLRIC
jgi:5-methylcytosine-specific restriction endonuclease McrA